MKQEAEKSLKNKSRVHYVLQNVKVSLFFTLISFFLGFFSRKILLDRLGAEFIGLAGTLQSILGFLNIAELGIGIAISYALYKPLAEGNQKKLNEIISVMGYLYHCVGLFILGSGVVLSVFLPFIFSRTGLSLWLIYFGFYSYLISSLFGYFLNYRMTMLTADQKNYIVTKNLQMSGICQQVLQIAAALYCNNLYLYFAIILFFSGVFSILLNRQIKIHYPWINASISTGRKELKNFPEIKKNIKQIVAHKIGTLAQYQVSTILIYAFVSLKEVAYYSNYTTVISKISGITGIVSGSSINSVGNLIAGSSREKILNVYKEMFAMQFFIAGFTVFMLYHLLEPFIILWLGAEFVMSKVVLIVILIDTFLSLYRGITDQFLYGHGLFHDIWAPYTEAVLVVIFSSIGGYFWGVSGIISGCIVSKVIIIGIWKPYFLFSSGMKTSIWVYTIIFIRNLVSFIFAGAVGSFAIRFLPFSAEKSFVYWVGYACCCGVVYLIISVPFIFLFVPGGNGVFNRCLKLLRIRPV